MFTWLSASLVAALPRSSFNSRDVLSSKPLLLAILIPFSSTSVHSNCDQISTLLSPNSVHQKLGERETDMIVARVLFALRSRWSDAVCIWFWCLMPSETSHPNHAPSRSSLFLACSLLLGSDCDCYSWPRGATKKRLWCDPKWRKVTQNGYQFDGPLNNWSEIATTSKWLHNASILQKFNCILDLDSKVKNLSPRILQFLDKLSQLQMSDILGLVGLCRHYSTIWPLNGRTSITMSVCSYTIEHAPYCIRLRRLLNFCIFPTLSIFRSQTQFKCTLIWYHRWRGLALLNVSISGHQSDPVFQNLIWTWSLCCADKIYARIGFTCNNLEPWCLASKWYL